MKNNNISKTNKNILKKIVNLFFIPRNNNIENFIETLSGKELQEFIKNININPTKKCLTKFEYFSQCKDSNRLLKIPFNKNGYSASECFYVNETYGKILPCKEPELLSRALNGKEKHGITITNCAEDYINRLMFSIDIKKNYPTWVQEEIYSRAKQICQNKDKYMPEFVSSKKDFTTIFDGKNDAEIKKLLEDDLLNIVKETYKYS